MNIKLDTLEYRDANQFAADVRLVFDNATTFNDEASQLYKDANDLKVIRCMCVVCVVSV